MAAPSGMGQRVDSRVPGVRSDIRSGVLESCGQRAVFTIVGFGEVRRR